MTGLVDQDKLQVRSRQRWFGHIHRRENDQAQKSTDQCFSPREKTAGWPKNAGENVLKET